MRLYVPQTNMSWAFGWGQNSTESAGKIVSNMEATTWALINLFHLLPHPQIRLSFSNRYGFCSRLVSRARAHDECSYKQVLTLPNSSFSERYFLPPDTRVLILSLWPQGFSFFLSGFSVPPYNLPIFLFGIYAQENTEGFLSLQAVRGVLGWLLFHRQPCVVHWSAWRLNNLWRDLVRNEQSTLINF